MTKKAVHAKEFLLSNGVMRDGYLLIEDGAFAEWTAEKPSSDYEIIDCPDALIAPGLVDTHIHGRVGCDVMDCDISALKQISADLPKQGVTSWLSTTLTEPTESLSLACAAAADYRDEQTSKASIGTLKEARIEGVFLEGPFFTEKHKGAQNPDFLCPPSFEKLQTWQEAARGIIKKIAIAPEYEEALPFTQKAVDNGVVVGLAHTNATADEALACIDAGASIFIHTYNGMSGHHHRVPGVVSAALITADTTYGELICDGHHVHPLAAKILLAAKGAQHIVLISDCIRAGGLPDGPSKLGELDVIVKDGEARLAEGGSLAGSTIGLIQAVKNVVAWGMVDRFDALRTASTVPAVANNIDTTCGSIASGRAADFIVLDKDLNLLHTYIAGEEVYENA